MDERRKRIKKHAFSKENASMWLGPKIRVKRRTSNETNYKTERKVSVFIGVFRRFSVDERRKRIKKHAFSKENASMWLGPKIRVKRRTSNETNYKTERIKFIDSIEFVRLNLDRPTRSIHLIKGSLQTDRTPV